MHQLIVHAKSYVVRYTLLLSQNVICDTINIVYFQQHFKTMGLSNMLQISRVTAA